MGAVSGLPGRGDHLVLGHGRAALVRSHSGTAGVALNSVDGPLGYPTSAETAACRGGGCYQDYQGGAIIWSPRTGAQPPPRARSAPSARLDGGTGPLAYPTSDPNSGQPKAAATRTTRAEKSSGAPPPAPTLDEGPIRPAWPAPVRTARSATPPATSSADPRGGCYQDYQSRRNHLPPPPGAPPQPGPIRAAWAGSGFESGPLGYPTGYVTCGLPAWRLLPALPGRCIIWSPATGAHALSGDSAPPGPPPASWTAPSATPPAT